MMVALLALILLALVAPVAAQEPDAGLVIGTLEALPGADPAASATFFAWDVLSALSSGLVRQQPGSADYTLALAATHRVSADGLEHRFTLRPDAAFNDGTPITARLAADSINRMLAQHPDTAQAFWPQIRDAAVEPAAEGDVLVIRLSRPLAYLLPLLALPPFHPVHPETQSGGEFHSSGPYQIEAADADRLILGADPGWKGMPPATARLTIRRFSAPADLRDALVAGAVDVAWRGLSSDDTDIALRAENVREVRAPGMQAFYLLYGLRNKPFDAPEARQALLPLFDRELAVRTALRGRATALYTLLPPFLAGDADPVYPPFDAQAGSAALRESGFSRFRRIEGDWQTARALYGDEYGAAVEALTRTLARNPAVRIVRFDTEPDTFLDQIERGTARAVYVGWTPLVPHPAAYLEPLLASEGRLARAAGYANPDVDALLMAAALSNPEDARTAYQRAQAIAAPDVAAVPLWVPDQVALVGPRVDPASVVIAPNFRLHLDLLRSAR